MPASSATYTSATCSSPSCLPAFTLQNPQTLYHPTPFAYSHLAEVTHFQRILHISGQGGENVHGVLSTDFATQTAQAFANVQAALAHAHATLSDVAVLRILVVDHHDEKHHILIAHMQKIWGENAFPACTLIPVPRLALADMLIEVEATAYCL